MSNLLKIRVRAMLTGAIAITPWLIAMYTFYWLDSSGSWTPETPHRGKISVAILATGMVLSFLIQSRFLRRKKK